MQIAPALAALAGASTSQSIVLKLDPGELGRVDIRIDRSADGPVAVRLTAEKPQTLTLLTRDQAALERTLDQAGIPAQGRTISYHVATTDGLANDILRAAPSPTHAATLAAPGQTQTPSSGGGLASDAPRHVASHSGGDPGLSSTAGGQGGDGGGSGGQRQRGESRSAGLQALDEPTPATAPWRARSATPGATASGVDITA